MDWMSLSGRGMLHGSRIQDLYLSPLIDLPGLCNQMLFGKNPMAPEGYGPQTW